MKRSGRDNLTSTGMSILHLFPLFNNNLYAKDIFVSLKSTNFSANELKRFEKINNLDKFLKVLLNKIDRS